MVHPFTLGMLPPWSGPDSQSGLWRCQHREWRFVPEHQVVLNMQVAVQAGVADGELPGRAVVLRSVEAFSKSLLNVDEISGSYPRGSEKLWHCRY